MYTDGKTVHYGYDEQIRLSELKEGGRIISYGYDALGRLSEIQKDGQIQTAYGYDAFGNRTWKEENGERTSYQYNILNQMVSEKHREVWKEYGYSSYWSRCRSRNKFNIARDKYCERKTEKN